MSAGNWKDLYWKYASDDLLVAEMLIEKNPRLCIYHLGQSLEKHLKAIIGKRLNLSNVKVSNEFVRDHNIEQIISRLCEIFGAEMGVSKEYLYAQIQSIIPTFFKIKFHVFNKVRYPRWNFKKKQPDGWSFKEQDCRTLIRELNALRNWLDALP